MTRRERDAFSSCAAACPLPCFSPFSAFPHLGRAISVFSERFFNHLRPKKNSKHFEISNFSFPPASIQLRSGFQKLALKYIPNSHPRTNPRIPRLAPRGGKAWDTSMNLNCLGWNETLEGSFSAVSKPIFACKYALESSRRDLHNALLCTVLESTIENWGKKNLAKTAPKR